MAMMKQDEAHRQREQMERFQHWQQEQGTDELPVQVSTYFRPDQLLRLDWIRSHVSGSVVEVGMNWGYVSAYIGSKGGCDVNLNLVAMAQLMARNRDFRVGSALDLPWEDDEFDTVLLPDVLEHLAWVDVPKALAEANRVAKYRIVITVPNGDENSIEALSFKHRYLMTRERLNALLTASPKARIDVIGDFYCVVARSW